MRKKYAPEIIEEAENETKKPLTKEEKAQAKQDRKLAREKKKKDNKSRPKDIKESTKRLMKYLKPFRGRLVLVGFFVVFSSIVGELATLLLGPIFKNLFGAISSGEDAVAVPDAIQNIGRYLIILAIVYTLTSLMTLAYNKIMLNVTQRVLNTMRRDLFYSIQNLPLKFFDTHKTGEIMSRFNVDVEAVNSLVSNGFISLINAFLQLGITLTIMIIYSPIITAVLFGSLFVMVIITVVIGQQSSKLYKKQHKILGDYSGYVEEHVRGQRCVKVFNREVKVKESLGTIIEDYRKTSVKAGVVSGLMSLLLSLVTRANYAIAVTLGAYLVMNGRMTIDKLIVYIQYAKKFGTPGAMIAAQYNSLLSALAGAERIFEVIDMKPETDEGYVTLVNAAYDRNGNIEVVEEKTGQWAWKVNQEDGSSKLVPLKGEVRFDNVDFQYKEGEPVLKNIDIVAQPGKKLAFVGSTGAGKTTITNLINRFYDVQNGKITYDGINVNDIKKDDLRHSLAMVLQDTRLFTGSIEDNIRYGRLDATHDEIVAAAKLANAHSFIEKLPNGYDTQLSTDGQNISTGQRQLISIARAAVADSPVLILDEATSSIDTRTERLIEVGMDSLMEGRTVFVIAHRLSTVRNSDDIIVLEKGEIIEEGNHAKLIDEQGKYYQLYTGQFKLT